MPMRIAEFIEASNAARTPADLVKCYEQAIGAFGYDRYLYAMITEDPVHAWHRVPRILGNYPESWMAHYVRSGYMDIDPLKEAAPLLRNAFRWDDVPKLINLSPKQRNCFYGGIEAGLNCGVGVPFHGPFGEVAGIGLTSSHKKIDVNKNVLSTLSLLSQQFHTAYLGLLTDPASRPAVKLTPREREVLLWSARGKSNWAIGEILGVSEETVKFHIKQCIAKLGSDSKITAVVKAIRLHLIYP